MHMIQGQACMRSILMFAHAGCQAAAHGAHKRQGVDDTARRSGPVAHVCGPSDGPHAAASAYHACRLLIQALAGSGKDERSSPS